jgi:DNA polymerase-3 subunit alpha
MAARAAVRDVSRALGYPYGVGDRIAKMIPFGSQGFPMTIDRALEIEEDLKNLYQSDEDAEIIINTAKKIEGNARHISIHAAGIVIAPSAVTDFVPVQYDPHGQSIITQYEMHAVEDAGLLKFDFLGLKNLSVLGDAVERVEKRKGEKVDIENIPLDDEKVFAMLARGETEGVFQLGGSGVTHFLKDLKPTSIHDINAMVALYRPGPMESIPSYIQRKHNPALIEHIDPRMEDVVKLVKEMEK